MHPELISVIIPIYNVSEFLPRCIDSVLKQTYSNLEIILVDDGSTDGSARICDKYAESDSRVKAFHKTNGGLSSSRNYGLEHASGAWIAFIDSDDWVSPDFISTLYELAQSHNADISYCNWYFAYQDKNVECNCFSPGATQQQTLTRLILESYHVVWNKLYRSSFLKQSHLCFPDHIQQYEEDCWFSCRAFFYTDVVIKTARPLYFYNRENVHAITRSYRTEEARNVRYFVYQDLLDFYHENHTNLYDKPIFWRILQEKSWMVLQASTFCVFNEVFPEANRHITDNPLLGWKMKILMWLVVHHMYGPARILVNLFHPRPIAS